MARHLVSRLVEGGFLRNEGGIYKTTSIGFAYMTSLDNLLAFESENFKKVESGKGY